MRWRWGRHKPQSSDESRAHYERALEAETTAHRIVKHERRLIRDNNFAPKFARAIREDLR